MRKKQLVKFLTFLFLILNSFFFDVIANVEAQELNKDGYGNYLIGKTLNEIKQLLDANKVTYKEDRSKWFISIRFKEVLFEKNWDLNLNFDLNTEKMVALSFSRYTVQNDTSDFLDKEKVKECEAEFGDILQRVSLALKSKPKVIVEDRFQNSDTYQWKFSNGLYFEVIHSCELGPYLIRIDFEGVNK